MDFQTKHTLVQMLTTAYGMFNSVQFTETQTNTIQDHFDALLALVNEKYKDASPPTDLVSVDCRRREHRKQHAEAEVETKPRKTRTKTVDPDEPVLLKMSRKRKPKQEV